MTTYVVEALMRGDAALAELRQQSPQEQRVAEVLRGAEVKADALRGRASYYFFLEQQRLARLGVAVLFWRVTQCNPYYFPHNVEAQAWAGHVGEQYPAI